MLDKNGLNGIYLDQIDYTNWWHTLMLTNHDLSEINQDQINDSSVKFPHVQK